MNMTKVKCPYCEKLLFKVGGANQGTIEIKCPRCKKMAQVTLVHIELSPGRVTVGPREVKHDPLPEPLHGRGWPGWKTGTETKK